MTISAVPSRNSEAAAPEVPPSRKALTLVVASFALFMAMLDNTVVNVALTAIQQDLGAGISGLQWVVSGYTLAFASLMLSGGTVADMFGRRATFLTGLITFTASSLVCALAPTTAWLIGARIMQGVGAALLQPASLAILTAAFPRPAERARAIGIWAGVSGLALGMGPVVGGVLVEHVGWQSVFLVNVPIGVVGALTAWRFVAESSNRAGRTLDIPGQILGVTALATATYALIESNARGWTSPTILSLLSVAAIATAAFVWVERGSTSPMLDLRFFRDPAFAGANVVGFAVGLGMFAIFFFLSLNLQQTYGYSALEAGLRILPVTLAIVLAAPIAGWLSATRGPKLPLVLGLLIAAIAQAMLLMLQVDSTYLSYAWILPLSGLGVGLTMTPMTAAVMEAVPAERAGMASATTNTAREVGGNFGIAFIGALLVARFTTELNDKLHAIGVPVQSRELIVESANKSGEAGGLPTTVNPVDVADAINQSFISGLHVALMVAAAFLILAAMVAAITIPGRRHLPQHMASHVAADPQVSGH